MFLMDRFFDGTFLTFGIEVISFAERDQEDRIDPMVYVFPRMTKCTFHKFGTSGTKDDDDDVRIILREFAHSFPTTWTRAVFGRLKFSCN